MGRHRKAVGALLLDVYDDTLVSRECLVWSGGCKLCVVEMGGGRGGGAPVAGGLSSNVEPLVRNSVLAFACVRENGAGRWLRVLIKPGCRRAAARVYTKMLVRKNTVVVLYFKREQRHAHLK